MNIKNFFIALCLLISTLTSAVFAAEQIDFSRTVKSIGITGLDKLQKNDAFQKEYKKTRSSFTSIIGNQLTPFDLSRDVNQLYLMGYFHSVEAHTHTQGNGISLEFRVTENPVIKSIHVTGNSVMSTPKLLHYLKLKPGDVLNVRKLKEGLDVIRTWHHAREYDLFRVITADMTDQNELHIVVMEGRVGNITWKGLHKIQPFILDRLLTCKKGSVFNSKQLRQDRDRLVRLGYFSDIFAPELKENPLTNEVDISYTVIEKNVNTLDTGLELDTRDNEVVAFFKGDLNHSLIHSDFLSGKVQMNVNNSELNFKGYSLHYSQPWFLNWVNMSFDGNVWLSFQDERTSEISNTSFIQNQRLGGEVIFGFPLIRDKLKFATRFKVEELSIPDDSNTGGLNVEPYSVQSITGILSYSSLDNRLNPKKGSYWSLEFERGQDMGISQVQALEFTRLSIGAATFFPLSPVSVIGFHVLGGIFRSDNPTTFVTFEREIFELGGASSLRGHKETNPFIGTREILFNVEYRYDFSDAIQGVLFYDAGRAFSEGYDLTPLTTGYGLGVRFSSPLGPIRFDLAVSPVIILHFSLGQLF